MPKDSSNWLPDSKLVIGMLHLPPLPGSPRFDASDYRAALGEMNEHVMADAEALVEGGVQALMLENFGDLPFYPGRVPAHVVSHMTAIANDLLLTIDVPFGINVLRNDGRSALAIAAASGAAFIRVNVLCGARVTDQGVIEGIAHDLLRDRVQIGATDIRIFADVDVKHSAPVGEPRPLHVEVSDTTQRGLADAIIISGDGTGAVTDLNHVRQAKEYAGDTPVFIGSGVDVDNITDYLDVADGVIVGSSLKHDGIVTNPVDIERVKRLMDRVG